MPTCPNCGRENADDVRFCGECGTALAVAEPREVRKTVTVLFADVTGSTALGEQLDPEALRRVMGRYFDEMKTVLEAHGGTVEKFIGDAVMAVFGVPVLHEDDALRAVLAANEMRGRLAALNSDLERDYGVAIEARIGVNTGEVVTGQGDSGQRLATGDAVNVAARLEQAAGPGQVLLGERTLELVRHAVDVDAIEPLPLKGKDERVPAFSLVRVLEGAPSFERRLDAPLVGRRDELATVRAAFDQAISERRCRLVTVVGPPGIGKSRLAREAAESLTGEASVLLGRCLPYGEGITYWPLREIFAAAGAEEELDEALTAPTPEDVFWGVRKALEQRAREQPLALVVEDIHWAEPTLLDLLEHLVDWARDAPLLLLCLARRELVDDRPSWVRHDTPLIALEPLSGRESDELIEGLIGSAELDEPTRTRIREVAEGNPLFVEQLLAMIAEGGEHERVPPTINALLAARLDGLPDEERDVLERASVIGLDFEWEALGELTPDLRRPAGSQLSALVRKELIRPHELLADTFRFRHILIRDAAYARIPKELRSELHERFADWLEPRGEEFGEIVGYHLEQAYRSLAELGPVGQRATELAVRAAEHLIAAAERGMARGDSRAAVSLLESAVSVLPDDDVRLLSALPRLGRALRDAGQMDDADAVLTEAIERGQVVGARLVVADASLARAELRFQPALISRDDIVGELETALPVLRESGDDAALARALGLGGRLRFWRGHALEAGEDLWQAALLARGAGARSEEAESLQGVLGTILHGPMSASDGLNRIEEMRPRAERNGRLETSLLYTEGSLAAMHADVDRARSAYSKAESIAREHGLETLRARYAGRVLAAIGALEGRLSDGVKAMRENCEYLEEVGERGFLASVAPALAEDLYRLGRDVEALEITERWSAELLTVPEDAHAQASWRMVRGKLLARGGDAEEGERLVRQGCAIAEQTDYTNLRAEGWADLGEVLRLAGALSESAAAASEALRLYEEKGNVAAVRLLAGETANR